MKLFIVYFLVIIAFIALFTIQCNAQTFEVLTVAHAVNSGYDAYFQMKDRHYYKTGQTELKKEYNSKWHVTGGLELGMSLALGGVSVLKNKDDWWEYGKDLLLFSAIRWTLRDGVYNSLNGNPFFHQSNSTTAKLEPFGMWYVKIGFLLTAIIVYYLL